MVLFSQIAINSPRDSGDIFFKSTVVYLLGRTLFCESDSFSVPSLRDLVCPLNCLKIQNRHFSEAIK